MSKLQLQDFYFGSALVALFKYNEDSTPSLIETIEIDGKDSTKSNSAQFWKISTNNSQDFITYIKYTTKIQPRQDDNVTVWTFPLTLKEKEKIKEYSKKGYPLYIILVCGGEKLDESEIAVLSAEDYSKIAHRTNIHISIRKSKDTPNSKPKKFFVKIGSKQNEYFKINRNQIEKKFECKNHTVEPPKAAKMVINNCLKCNSELDEILINYPYYNSKNELLGKKITARKCPECEQIYIDDMTYKKILKLIGFGKLGINVTVISDSNI